MSDKDKYIPYGRQWIDEDDIRAVTDVLRSDWLTQGPKIEEFEKKIAEYCGVRYAVVLNSGTAALHGAYFALGLSKDDEFITTPITFAATANAGIYLGAKPVFVDIEPDTGNIDTSKIESQITAKTKGIFPVHYSGHPVDLIKINEIARKHGLFIVEDACHAMGSRFNGEKIGSCKYSDMTVFSFHPLKHITTGEGGAVVTNDEYLYEKLLIFRSHGITKKHLLNESHGDWYYEMQLQGYNYRLTDLQAALGISQLKKLDNFIEKRRSISDRYSKAFRANPYFDTPIEKDYAFSAYHLYTLKLKDKYKGVKKNIVSSLKKKGIGTQVHYIPVYRHPFYNSMGFQKDMCPIAEDFYLRELSIPLYPAMNDDDINYVVKIIIETFQDI
ncbi:MAG TPA: UDP-4-amino-4,6-dideoxy-N-acetyl-beta-L-altrosamine transaminase [Deltaproteobacteria bacterium]|nr:UDP-4-amino-4,6-dideoxy-N-acetyl-beta-L-altrosamine transaminase [Deltaproteobacteria bacterium]